MKNESSQTKKAEKKEISNEAALYRIGQIFCAIFAVMFLILTKQEMTNFILSLIGFGVFGIAYNICIQNTEKVDN